MIKSIYTSQLMSLYNDKNKFAELAKFIVKNRSEINEAMNIDLILANVQSINSPLTGLFNIFAENSLQQRGVFTFVNSSKGVSDTQPALLNIPFYDPDIKDIMSNDDASQNAISPINIFPEYKNKIIVNVYPFWNDKTRRVTNQHLLVHNIVKDVFSRSYLNMKDTSTGTTLWLSGEIIKDLGVLYGKVYSSLFVRPLDLTVEETNKLALIFVMYFIQSCSTNKDEVFHRQFTEIAQLRDIIDFEKAITDINAGRLPSSLEEVEKVAKEFVTPRFNLQALFLSARTLASDYNVAQIAIEYPPYWLYLIVSMVSKENKSRLYHVVQGQSSLKNAAQNLMKRLGRQMFDSVWKN